MASRISKARRLRSLMKICPVSKGTRINSKIRVDPEGGNDCLSEVVCIHELLGAFLQRDDSHSYNQQRYKRPHNISSGLQHIAPYCAINDIISYCSSECCDIACLITFDSNLM